MKKENDLESKEKVYGGALAILFRIYNNEKEFLVVENAKSGNITFPSGAMEETDTSNLDTIKRELNEELNIKETLNYIPVNVKHEFIFGSKKPERAGRKGSYQVYVADMTSFDKIISPTIELSGVKWMTEDELMEKITFPDLKEVFIQTLKEIK